MATKAASEHRPGLKPNWKRSPCLVELYSLNLQGAMGLEGFDCFRIPLPVSLKKTWRALAPALSKTLPEKKVYSDLRPVTSKDGFFWRQGGQSLNCRHHPLEQANRLHLATATSHKGTRPAQGPLLFTLGWTAGGHLGPLTCSSLSGRPLALSWTTARLLAVEANHAQPVKTIHSETEGAQHLQRERPATENPSNWPRNLNRSPEPGFPPSDWLATLNRKGSSFAPEVL